VFPRIIEFLGYDPYPAPQSLGERLAAIRKSLGMPRVRPAEMIGIDEGTLLRIERGKPIAGGKCGARATNFLAIIPTLV